MEQSEEEIEALVDQLLLECVPGYKVPERKPKKKKVVSPKDSFESK